jgi:single-stranded-DNA-specific exonuclease
MTPASPRTPAWRLLPVDEPAVAALARALDVLPTTARLLWLRGHRTPEAARAFLAAREDLAFLDRPPTSPGLERAVARLRRAIAEEERICVFGDYDADGVTSAALLCRYLARGPGARVEVRLPDRRTDGYGLGPAAVARLAAEGFRVIVTCDNGIAAHAAADAAREAGIDLVVTDHHTPAAALPDAYAIVHPALGFPDLADLAGVGVAFVLAVAMEGGLSARLRPLLDLVALGTIADVAPLGGPNRALVWAGLHHVRTTARLRPGLRALIEAQGRVRAESLTARDVAFSLAPLLNAAGRMQRPDLAFDLLVTDDLAEARRLADELVALNHARRRLDQDTVARLVADLERARGEDLDRFVVLADADLHPGITGIAAGRLRERLGRPVLLLAEHPDGSWKGSGRSPDGVHLYDALASCHDLLEGYGGHAMAAGCTVRREAIPALRARLNQHLAATGWTPDLAPEIALEATPALAEAGPRLAEELARLEPCGRGNPPPALGGLGLRVAGARTDAGGRHLFLTLDDGTETREVVWWGHAADRPPVGARVNAAYALRRRMGRSGGAIELVADAVAPAEADVSRLG